jgi:hypothetical protein
MITSASWVGAPEGPSALVPGGERISVDELVSNLDVSANALMKTLKNAIKS